MIDIPTPEEFNRKIEENMQAGSGGKLLSEIAQAMNSGKHSIVTGSYYDRETIAWVSRKLASKGWSLSSKAQEENYGRSSMTFTWEPSRPAIRDFTPAS